LILISLNKLSESQAHSGDVHGAIATQEEVVALAEQTFGRESTGYSSYLSNLGNMYADVGRLADAERMLRESLEIDRRIRPPDDEDMPVSLNNLATILVDEDKCEDAIPLHEESIAMRRRLSGVPSTDVAIALGNYARALNCAGRHTEALVAADSALAMSITVFGPGHQRTATARVRIAEVLMSTGRAGEAEPFLRDAIGTFRGINERFWRVGDARARLGEALLAQGRRPEGIAEVEAGWEIYTETTATGAPRSREIAALAAAYYDETAERALADRWRLRAAGGSGE
jgi:tetratricopeptide (TPR) repeat protein